VRNKIGVSFEDLID